jgi:hypothetical protein
VRDLLAHVTGNCASVLGQEPAPADSTLAELLVWWAENGPRMEHLVATTGRDIQRLLMDTFTHELDLREALDAKPPADDHPAYPPAFEVVTRGLSWSLTARALPALRLISDGTTWVVGPDQPVATVSASHHPLYRSLSGRRTPAQIAELDWSEDPARWLPAFYWGPFSPPEQDPLDRP